VTGDPEPQNSLSDARFHLFAYGSLRAVPGPGDLLRGCQRVGAGSVTGTLYDVGDYPALLLAGSDRVSGVVLRCPADRLLDLDRYEGVERGLFRRAAVEVSGRACWVYVAGPRLGPKLVPGARIESGEWDR
jgi:gamma-glutamylcyclotransferase (GGCT)/AIG2-like uncharacterized protein YtfP